MNLSRFIGCAMLVLLHCPTHALTLQQAQEAMLASSPDLQDAAAQWRASEADVDTASRRPAAALEWSTSKISRRAGIGSGSLYDKRVDSTAGLNWTWERGAKRKLRTTAARQLAAAAAHELQDERRNQVLRLQVTYYELKAAQEKLVLAQANQSLSEQSLQAAQRRVAAGELAPIEHHRLTVEHLQIMDVASDAELELQAAQEALALLTGIAEPQALTAQDDWPALIQPQLEHHQYATAHRPDMLAAELRLQAAHSARQMARAQRKRDLGLGIEVEREPQDISSVTWGFSFSIPLTGPNHYRGLIARADAEHDSAAIRHRQLSKEITLQLNRAARELAQANTRRQRYLEELLPAADRALQGIELAYQRGSASLTDLLDARRAWRAAEADLIDSHAMQAIALATWRAVTDISAVSPAPP